MTGVIATDSCYYATGVVADTLPQQKTGSLFSKFDLNGELVFHKTVTAPDKTYETWSEGVEPGDGSLVLVGNSTDSVPTGFFMKYSLMGDTLFYKEYPNPEWPAYFFMRPVGGIQQTTNGGFISCNNIQNGDASNDIYLVRTDSAGQLEWDSIYQLPYFDIPRSIIPNTSGGFIVGSKTHNQQLVTENFISRAYIFNINEQGEVLWEYSTPDSIGLRDGAKDMVLLDDGSLIVASGVGTEIEYPTGNHIWFEKMLFKLSPNGEIEWENIYENPGPKNSVADLTNVIEVSDGSGLVIAGVESVLGLSNFTVKGWIAKVKEEGSTLWTRRYLGIESEEPRHKIYDLKETTDGGFILVGESKDATGDTEPSQQAWLLKLDEHGCLVPGCHLLDDTEEETESPLKLAIYPNPTSDYLNFQLRSNNYVKSGMFRIVSSDGRLTKSFYVDVREEDTFILPVWDWPKGAYFLQFLDAEGSVFLSEKFVKH